MAPQLWQYFTYKRICYLCVLLLRIMDSTLKTIPSHQSEIVAEIKARITPLEKAQTHARMFMACKIHDAMEAKGWKHADLLKAMNRKQNPSLVSKWLSGTHNFTMETLVELEQVLEVRFLDLGE